MLIQAGAPLDQVENIRKIFDFQVTEAGLRGAPIHYAAGKGFKAILTVLQNTVRIDNSLRISKSFYKRDSSCG